MVRSCGFPPYYLFVDIFYNLVAMKIFGLKQSTFLIPLALIFAVLLFVGGPDSSSLRSFRYVWGVGHLFCFALWTYFYVEWRPAQPFRRQVVEVFILTFLVGGMVELIQSQIGREAAWQDLGNDLIGSMLGMAFVAPSRKTVSRWTLRAFQLPVVLLACWSLFPVAQVLVDDVIARQQFPLLSGFETPLEISRWSGSAHREVSNEIAFSGQSSLKIRLSTHLYSGLGLKDFPRDWSGYRSISLQIFNPESEPLKLHFRVHDLYHSDHDNAYSDRFNTTFSLHQGWNHLQVPLQKIAHAPKTRQLDLTQVGGMGVFVGKLKKSRTIYLDDVRLLPK